MGYILAFLPYAIQLFLIIHCIKTGRSGWLWLLVFLPYIGGIVYIIMVVVPDLRESGMLNKAGNSIDNKIHPNKKIEELKALVRKQETIANIVALADAYVDNNNPDEAIELYKSCLSGPYEHDGDIEFKIVKAYLSAEKFNEAKTALDKYKENNSINSSERALVELLVNQDYAKIEEIFENTGNFEVGYELAKHYSKDNNIENIERIVNQMNEYRKDYPALKKGKNASLYKRTKSLLKY